MTSKLTSLVLASATALSANAQELKQEEKPLLHNVYALSGWHSKYLGSYGFSVTETPVIQSDIGFSIGKVNYDAWSNFNLKREKLTEIDHTLSTSFSLGKFALTPSVVYFNSPSKDFGDAVELGLRVSRNDLPVKLSLFGAHVFGKGIKPGQAFDLQASKSFSLTDKLSLNAQADVWYNNAYWAKESGFSHAQGKLSVSYSLTKNASVSTYFKGQKALNSLGGTFKDNSQYGVMANLSF